MRARVSGVSKDAGTPKVCASDLLKWDESHGHRFTHDLFRFPGKFHPPLVETLLKTLRPTGVIDPMAGVGTVAVEAKAAGIPSLSIDVDPVSAFFARVKTFPLSRRTLESAWRDFQPVVKLVRRPSAEIARRRFQDIRIDALRHHLTVTGRLDLESLDYWFRRYVIADVSRLDHAIWNGGLPQRHPAVRSFFKACLLATVRRISNADPSPVSGLEITSHMRERLARGYSIDVSAEFTRRVRLNIDRMDSYRTFLLDAEHLDTPAHVVHGQANALEDIQRRVGVKANLILFSPPYCNAIEYWRRHRLEYFVGGFLTEQEVVSQHRRFIGRRVIGHDTSVVPPTLKHAAIDETIRALHRSDRRAKAWQLWHYFHEMRSHLDVFYRALPRQGAAVFVVGDSRTGSHTIPTAEILQSMAVGAGFAVEATARYSIKNRSMQYPLKAGDRKIAEEAVVVLRKRAR